MSNSLMDRYKDADATLPTGCSDPTSVLFVYQSSGQSRMTVKCKNLNMDRMKIEAMTINRLFSYALGVSQFLHTIDECLQAYEGFLLTHNDEILKKLGKQGLHSHIAQFIPVIDAIKENMKGCLQIFNRFSGNPSLFNEMIVQLAFSGCGMFDRILAESRTAFYVAFRDLIRPLTRAANWDVDLVKYRARAARIRAHSRGVHKYVSLFGNYFVQRMDKFRAWARRQERPALTLQNAALFITIVSALFASGAALQTALSGSLAYAAILSGLTNFCELLKWPTYLLRTVQLVRHVVVTYILGDEKKGLVGVIKYIWNAVLTFARENIGMVDTFMKRAGDNDTLKSFFEGYGGLIQKAREHEKGIDDLDDMVKWVINKDDWFSRKSPPSSPQGKEKMGKFAFILFTVVEKSVVGLLQWNFAPSLCRLVGQSISAGTAAASFGFRLLGKFASSGSSAVEAVHNSMTFLSNFRLLDRFSKTGTARMAQDELEQAAAGTASASAAVLESIRTGTYKFGTRVLNRASASMMYMIGPTGPLTLMAPYLILVLIVVIILWTTQGPEHGKLIDLVPARYLVIYPDGFPLQKIAGKKVKPDKTALFERCTKLHGRSVERCEDEINELFTNELEYLEDTYKVPEAGPEQVAAAARTDRRAGKDTADEQVATAKTDKKVAKRPKS